MKQKLTHHEPLKHHCFFTNQIRGSLGYGTYSPLEVHPGLEADLDELLDNGPLLPEHQGGRLQAYWFTLYRRLF